MVYFDIVFFRRLPWGLSLFTYSHPEPVVPGAMVRCRFRGRDTVGIVWRTSTVPPTDVAVQPITEVVGGEPWFTAPQMACFDWFSSYYATPLPTLCYLYGVVPVRRSRAVAEPAARPPPFLPAGTALSWVQHTQAVIQCAPARIPSVTLEYTRASGLEMKSILILAPTVREVAGLHRELSAQAARPVVAFTGATNRSEKTAIWRRLRGEEPAIVVGTNAAAFLPFAALGSVLTVNEGDPAAKAVESRPLLHLATVAEALRTVYRCRRIAIDHTPAAATIHRAQEQQWPVVSLQSGAPRHELTVCAPPLLRAPSSIERLTAALNRGARALILAPRRSDSSFLQCLDCHHLFRCPRCTLPLRVVEQVELACHRCGFHETAVHCPGCGGLRLRQKLLTVATVAHALAKQFPGILVATYESEAGPDPQAPLVVATIAALYGLDLAAFALRVAVSFDTLLQQPHFQASERAYRVLQQLVAAGPTLVESHVPDHSVLHHWDNWSAFIQAELRDRRVFALPPVVPTRKLSIDGWRSGDVAAAAARLLQQLSTRSSLEVIGPLNVPGRSPRRRFRRVVLVKEMRPGALDQLGDLDYSQWTLDPDPIDFE